MLRLASAAGLPPPTFSKILRVSLLNCAEFWDAGGWEPPLRLAAAPELGGRLLCVLEAGFGAGGGHHTVTDRLPGCPVAAGAQQWEPADTRACGSVTVENAPLQICFNLHAHTLSLMRASPKLCRFHAVNTQDQGKAKSSRHCLL